MDVLLTVLVFLVMTMPVATALVLLLVGRSHTEPEWRPSSYQPMEILTARAKAAREATEPAHKRAA